jgi:CHAT domain-containing protein/Flp pilus assembly protein TadD
LLLAFSAAGAAYAQDDWEALNREVESLYRSGQYGRAAEVAERALSLAEKTYGPNHPAVAISLNDLGALYREMGRHDQAEPLYVRALQMREKALGPNHPHVAVSMGNLGVLYFSQGRYAQADPLLRAALAINEQAYGPDHPVVAHSLTNLAELHQALGHYVLVEPLLRRALAINERNHGPDHPAVALGLNNLAGVYDEQGQAALAAPLYQRALAIAEKTLGPDHPAVARSLNNLAGAYDEQGLGGQAGPLYRRSLAIVEKAFGAVHPTVATSLSNLAMHHLDREQTVQAEPLLRRSLDIREKLLGQDHPDVAISLVNLAKAGRMGGKLAEAETLYRRALVIQEKKLGAAHPRNAVTLMGLARAREAGRRPAEALAAARQGFKLLRARFSAGDAVVRLSEQKAYRDDFGFFVRLLAGSRGQEAAAEAFEAAQLAQASGVGQSVARMAARFAGRDDGLARAIRDHQEMAHRLARAEEALLHALGQPPERIDGGRVAALRKQSAEMEKSLAELRQDLSRRFPQYDAMTSPAPVALAEARNLPRPEEALVLYLVADRESFILSVRAGAAEFLRIDAGAAVLGEWVTRFRETLDPLRNPGMAPPDLAAARELYRQLFAPLERGLAGVRHVILVPDGPLQSLPFAALVDRMDRPGKPSYLADRFAFSVIPSVAALRALRIFSRPGPAAEPFVGFGDPVFEGAADSSRQVSARNLFVQAGATAPKGIADVEGVRRAPPLPDTATELRALAETLQAGSGSVHLRDRASERLVKQADLSRYRVLAFATHGVMAGEMGGVAEPGLLLTPPPAGSAEDDGYLTASEAAQLRLNADWVLLSACNTAAPDGTPGAEGLSGLARGFFHAGARSLLVSNWAVESRSAVALTTGMLRRYAADPQIGKAEALRLSMRQLRDEAGHAHPMFWAPFMVVGEGLR